MRKKELPSRIIEVEIQGKKQKFKLPFVLHDSETRQDIDYEKIIENLPKYTPLIQRILEIEGQNVIIPIRDYFEPETTTTDEQPK
jgi:hypothetical protein